MPIGKEGFLSIMPMMNQVFPLDVGPWDSLRVLVQACPVVGGGEFELGAHHLPANAARCESLSGHLKIYISLYLYLLNLTDAAACMNVLSKLLAWSSATTILSRNETRRKHSSNTSGTRSCGATAGVRNKRFARATLGLIGHHCLVPVCHCLPATACAQAR